MGMHGREAQTLLVSQAAPSRQVLGLAYWAWHSHEDQSLQESQAARCQYPGVCWAWRVDELHLLASEASRDVLVHQASKVDELVLLLHLEWQVVRFQDQILPVQVCPVEALVRHRMLPELQVVRYHR
mmetsp:Transcript_135232/g.431776  ORF Transcript_135232/g.431776 Transcript_135232/m.431776 type:complete len:127 (+) Transcript_135232:917-1297(+)